MGFPEAFPRGALEELLIGHCETYEKYTVRSMLQKRLRSCHAVLSMQYFFALLPLKLEGHV